ncbi:hypothetical protein B0I00_1645 [Novosphingobium kunmingense]|uniref:Dolichyl-phosphate-mannose-protein mannosyltransferase n=1 Tax=Novosphingobium kunmingense TaxID=1211806 RepID=A0A2N0HKE0_9SPHN|nr:hypothetical protein [Novosphingobium kunmingense]PKB19412.1 hypothetical protein B0I00_1645 [Novosphingobium kunmingense]
MPDEPRSDRFVRRRLAPLAWLAREPGARESLVFGLLLAFASIAPVLVAVYPQMVDYPAHLARFHIMLERDNSAFLQQYYGFKWRWMGNLGADLLIQPLAHFFPLETAGRIIVALIPPLTGLGIVAVEWALRRRVGLGAIMAMMFIWSPALLLGFLNFGLSLAAALFVFAAWVLLEGKRWRWIVMIPAGFLVWVCHVSGWGALGLMVFGYEWSRDKSWRACLAPWPLAFPLIALVFGAGTKGLASYGYGESVAVYKWSIWRQAMRDSIKWLDYASMIGVLATLALSAALRRIDPRLGWGTVLLLLSSLALPRHIFAGDLVDARMISTGLMVGCLALAWRAPRWVLLVAAAFFLGRLTLTTQDWQRDSRETAHLLETIDRLPMGARLATVVITERSWWQHNPQEHICGYALVRRDALVNCNFALPMVHMMTINEGGRYFRDPYHRLYHRTGATINLLSYDPAKHADWFWYVGVNRPDKLPLRAKVIEADRHTLLARLAKRPDGS